MPPFVWHLWAPPPLNLPIACPPASPGNPPPPPGTFAQPGIDAAYQWVAYASLVLVLVAVLLCYLTYRSSLSRGFVRRWWMFLGGTMLAGAAVAALLLAFLPQHAQPGTCSTMAFAFEAPLPSSLIMARAAAGLVWCGLVYVIASILATLAAGWHPASGGFFHNRGCPWPRWNPFGA